MPEFLKEFVSGPAGAVDKLNAIIRAVQALQNVSGDVFISVAKSQAGYTISLNFDEVRKRIRAAEGSTARARSATVIQTGKSYLICYLNVWVWDDVAQEMRWEIDDSKQINVWCRRFQLGSNDIDSEDVWPQYKRGDNIWIIQDYDGYYYPMVPFYDTKACPGETTSGA
jgi:hypothetical protein